MKIKNKLLLGFGLLSVVIMFFGVISIYYIEKISESSKITLKNNYETLTFTRDMRAVLDENDLPLSAQAAGAFDKALKKQENNITEPGERETTANVRKAFGLLIDATQSLSQKLQTERSIRLLLKKIDGLNMHAIVAKNNYIRSDITKTTLYLGGMGFITFLILFVFIVNFPGFILNPLNQFTDGVREIGKKNYDIRLEFKTSDEFADLAYEFNNMASGLSESENVSLTRIFSEEVRIKTLIEQMQDIVLGINEKQEVLFINPVAKKILNIGDKQVIGKPVSALMNNSHLVKLILENKDKADHLKVLVDGKVSYFQQKSIEIVVPNLKPNPLETIQFAGYSAGMIYILKDVSEFKEHDVV
jgi:NtrC-family two-component system sensor histidine kinase KinB